MPLFLPIFRNFSLRNIDHKVAHLLQLGNDIHVEHAHLIVVVRVLLDIDDMLLAKSISAFIDIILGILSIGDVLQAV